MTDTTTSKPEAASSPVSTAPVSSSPVSLSPTPMLFAVAVFTSAALVFGVQPMVTKLVLPMLGGSPSVWNTAMVFFQAALLAGYGYAHLLQKVRSLKAQVLIHLVLLLAAALFLPLTISGVLGDPDPSAPILWLLATLALSVGAPFAVLSATAPLMQAWYARVRAGEPDGKNPYALYAASNLGSFLALIAYPIAVEPLMTLSSQRISWSVGYGVFILIVIGLAVLVSRRRGDAAPEPKPLAVSAPISWRDKGVLVLIAAAPSSLMLGVTAHLSTDVASAPFLWVVPLALYLLTFVIAFQNKPWIPLWMTLLFQAAAVVVWANQAAFRTGNLGLMFAVHLTAFFFVTLMCHQTLAARRPAPDRLTEFYLLMSLGGVVGGAFTAMLAPVLFRTVLEYPLVMLLAILVRPWNLPLIRPWQIWLALGGVFVAVAPPVLFEVMRYNPGFYARFGGADLILLAKVTLGAAALIGFLLRDRAWLCLAVVASMTVSGYHISRGFDWSFTERSFFGVMRVANVPDPKLGGDVHVMMHGTTLHGAQAVNELYACSPTMYYAQVTPLGQAATMVQARGASNMGVIGQGSGAMAAYKRGEDAMNFFEIDPMVDRLARDPKWFTYISDCAEGPVRTVLGDARLTLEREPRGGYDLLVVDAFSSDAIPTHLLTVEAIQSYLDAMKPNGVVVLHLSNRHLDIVRPAIAAARQLGVPALHQIYYESEDAADMAEASTEAVILSPTEAGLADFRRDARWSEMEPDGVKPWTDDYVNLFGALTRNMNR